MHEKNSVRFDFLCRSLWLLALTVFTSLNAAAQPTNDNCASAGVVTIAVDHRRHR
jgi:chitodextrinase